jgi:hypothetical protein
VDDAARLLRVVAVGAAREERSGGSRSAAAMDGSRARARREREEDEWTTSGVESSAVTGEEEKIPRKLFACLRICDRWSRAICQTVTLLYSSND